MRFNYPNGTTYSNSEPNPQKKQVKKAPSTHTFANRGMTFEEAINQSNEYYRERKIALVHKKTTPIQIVKVDYPSRSAAVIREAYFKQASTTDYNGVYEGYHLDFEAKETKNKTSFPLHNFHEHQVNHMKACKEHGGIAFVLLWFSTLKRCFFIESDLIITFWKDKEQNRKSIPLALIEEQGIEIHTGFNPRIPYITALRTHIEKETHNHAKRH